MNQGFLDQLDVYKASIDGVIEQAISELALPDAYTALLQRGGKRIRGALVMVGYEMLGGKLDLRKTSRFTESSRGDEQVILSDGGVAIATPRAEKLLDRSSGDSGDVGILRKSSKDRQMILRAALAIEMMHTYILIIDDIQDRSDMRRGGPTVHKYLENMSQENIWRGDHAHTGISLALNEALAGAHKAQKIIISLDIDPKIRLKVLELINQTMTTTAQGQTGDIINEVGPEPDVQAIDKVLLNKTARYTVLNPLQVGMALAGSAEIWWPQLTQYAEAAGRVFQITDDLLVFSEDQDKDPAGDIREGKMTHIALHALTHCSKDERGFLESQFGNPKLNQTDFAKVKDIFISSGAKDYAESEAHKWTEVALTSLKGVPDNWDTMQIDFLRELVQSFVGRLK